MTTNELIAAIKEHLKGIEAEKQPKKEPKRYLMIPVDYNSPKEVVCHLFESTDKNWKDDYWRMMTGFFTFKDFILSGKIITINEE